nr:recQ-mediated genome instability protein 2-like [Dasypus novemcinctus]
MAAAWSLCARGSVAVKLPRSPPLQVLAEQRRRDVERGPGAWRRARAGAGRGPRELAAGGMQGTVLAAGGDGARLRDPSAPFSVRGLERVPRGRPCLEPGKYVTVLGVIRACNPEPCLQAVKMTHLSENPTHERTWELEVEDLHRNIP